MTNIPNTSKIIRYVRDEDGNPLGCVVAIGPGEVGWSYCRKGDTFTKRIGVQIATDRALVGWGKHVQMPRLVEPLYNKVVEISETASWSPSDLFRGN